MSDAPQCPKCAARDDGGTGRPIYGVSTSSSVTMEQGYLLDHTYGAQVAGEWVEGPPQASFWTGLSLRGREHIPITTWRCPTCGYLESYATPVAKE
jgi:hypothetical protein